MHFKELNEEKDIVLCSHCTHLIKNSPLTTTLRTDHDALMAHFSVKDQYCNLKTGNWHESIFLGTDTCKIHHHWWEFHDNPIDLTFTSDGCIHGLQLKSCHKGACPRDTYAHAEHFQYLVDSVDQYLVDSVESER